MSMPTYAPRLCLYLSQKKYWIYSPEIRPLFNRSTNLLPVLYQGGKNLIFNLNFIFTLFLISRRPPLLPFVPHPKVGEIPSFRYRYWSSNCISRSFSWILIHKQSLHCFKTVMRIQAVFFGFGFGFDLTAKHRIRIRIRIRIQIRIRIWPYLV